MSKSFWEQKFEDFRSSHSLEVANLDYLDLAKSEKVTQKDIAYNLQILSYRTDLGHKVGLAATHRCCEQVIKKLESENTSLRASIKAGKAATRQLQEGVLKLKEAEDINHQEILRLKAHLVSSKPLTKEDVEALVLKISEQPKFIEKQTEALIEELSAKVNKVEALIHRLEKVIMGA